MAVKQPKSKISAQNAATAPVTTPVAFLDLGAIAQAALGDTSTHLVTRATGELLRAKVEGALGSALEPSVTLIDFARAGILDFSCADELVAKLVSRLVSGEYGDRYVALGNISNEHKENIQVALERKQLAVLGWNGAGKTLSILGTLNPHLRQALDLVITNGTITAKQIAKRLGIEINTAGTRLINLHKRRLVLRSDRVLSVGGREFIYLPLM